LKKEFKLRHLSLSRNRQLERERLLESLLATKQLVKRQKTFQDRSHEVSLLLEQAEKAPVEESEDPYKDEEAS